MHMVTVSNFRNPGVLLEPPSRNARRRYGFGVTRMTYNGQLCRSGRSQVSSLRVHAEDRGCESFPCSRPEARKVLPDLNTRSVGKNDQPIKRSSASQVSSTEPKKIYDLDGQLVTSLETALRYYFKEVITGCTRILKHPNPARALGNILKDEMNMIYLMICNDFSAAMLPYWCMGANLLSASPSLNTGDYHHFLFQAATTMSKEVCYSFLYLYSFNLANQYMGATGDATDKPWRPIPSGLLTREGALARCVLVNLLYDFVSWHLGVLHWTLMWQAIIASQFGWYEKDQSSRGLGRSVGMFVGTVVLCYAGVSLTTTMTPALQLWTVTRGALNANHHWMQDFRDVEGDEKVGRTTFPLLFGVERARKLMGFIFLMDPIYLHFVVMKDSSYSIPQLVLEGLGALLCAIIAFRVMNLKSPAEDNETYTLWFTTYWHNWTFLVVGPAFLVGLNSHI
ncbi:unnamed protein product [Calypogeia fissa]